MMLHALKRVKVKIKLSPYSPWRQTSRMEV